MQYTGYPVMTALSDAGRRAGYPIYKISKILKYSRSSKKQFCTKFSRNVNLTL